MTDLEQFGFNKLMNEMEIQSNMFGPSVYNRILGQKNGADIIT